MDKQEWQGYVAKAATGNFPIPPGLIQDYDDWRCRSTVGRVLFILKDIEGAITVLSTVKDIKPDMEDVPEYGLSEVEHKVLCLRDLAEIVWMLTGTTYAPQIYLEEAYELCRNYKHIFRSADRGKIWIRRLEILREAGEVESALKEVRELLEREGGEEKINSYCFRAKIFLAECAAAGGEYGEAAKIIREAYAFFPYSDSGSKAIAEAYAEVDPQLRYEKMLHCTTIQYSPWEKADALTPEEVRARQMENYKRRMAGGEAPNDFGLLNRLNE